MAEVRASRTSRSSVIGSTMPDCTAAAIATPLRDQPRRMDQHAGGGAFVEAVAAQVARPLADVDQQRCQRRLAAGPRGAMISASTAGAG